MEVHPALILIAASQQEGYLNKQVAPPMSPELRSFEIVESSHSFGGEDT
jgi:hypothetical protein